MKKKILVVEDDGEMRRILETLLAREGYEPICPRTVGDFKGVIHSGLRYDLAIVDLEPAGDEVIKESKLFNPDAPVIIYSGYELKDQDIKRLEADGLVLKDKGFNNLVENMERLLEQDV